MSSIGDARAAIALVVKNATGLKTYDGLQARTNVPCAIVMPGSPYVVDGDVFGTFRVSYTVDLVMGSAANSVTQDGLDAQLETALIALVNAGYSVESIGQPYALDLNNGTYLTATLSVFANISLT